MPNSEYTRKRNASLPRTTHDKREYMRHQAKAEGKSLIEYVEDKAAPQRRVSAFIKARNMQHDEDSNSNESSEAKS